MYPLLDMTYREFQILYAYTIYCLHSSLCATIQLQTSSTYTVCLAREIPNQVYSSSLFKKFADILLRDLTILNTSVITRTFGNILQYCPELISQTSVTTRFNIHDRSNLCSFRE